VKILVVNKFFWVKGGSERVLFELAAGYERAGHDVSHFAMRSARNLPSPWSGHFASELSWEGGTLARLRTAGRVIHSVEAARRIRELVRSVRPDVAHLHNFHHQLSPSIVDVLRREGIPAVHTLHDYKVICPNYLLYTEGAPCERCRGGRFYHAVLHRCVRGSRAASLVAFAEMTWHRRARTLERGIARFVSPSRFLRDKLVSFGFDERRIRVVPNGLDATTFARAERPGAGFLYAGRLSREKGVHTLLRAVGSVPGVRLTVCGTGPAEEELRALAQREAPGRVQFAGHLEADDLLARLRGSRALVLPSEWYENAPMAVLESLASGVPVVATDLGGTAEMVRDGVSGLLTPAGDAGALAERLDRLERSPDLAAKLGRAGRSIVESEYSLDAQVSAMLSIFREVAPSASR
jgi:glycosyltransferase involved in cell wall biosynthesis